METMVGVCLFLVSSAVVLTSAVREGAGNHTLPICCTRAPPAPHAQMCQGAQAGGPWDFLFPVAIPSLCHPRRLCFSRLGHRKSGFGRWTPQRAGGSRGLWEMPRERLSLGTLATCFEEEFSCFVFSTGFRGHFHPHYHKPINLFVPLILRLFFMIGSLKISLLETRKKLMIF